MMTDWVTTGGSIGLSRANSTAVTSNSIFTYNTAANAKINLAVTSRSDIVFVSGVANSNAGYEVARISGNASISGGLLAVTGAATISTTLNVTGAATLSSTTNVITGNQTGAIGAGIIGEIISSNSSANPTNITSYTLGQVGSIALALTAGTWDIWHIYRGRCRPILFSTII